MTESLSLSEYWRPHLYQGFDYQLIKYTDLDNDSNPSNPSNTKHIIYQIFSNDISSQQDSTVIIINIATREVGVFQNGEYLADTPYIRNGIITILENINNHYQTGQYIIPPEYVNLLFSDIHQYEYIATWQIAVKLVDKFKQDSRMLNTSSSIKLFKYLEKPIIIHNKIHFPVIYLLQHPEIINRYLVIHPISTLTTATTKNTTPATEPAQSQNIIEIEILYKPGYYGFGHIPDLRYIVRYFDCESPEKYNHILNNVHKILYSHLQHEPQTIIYTPYNHNQDNTADIDLPRLFRKIAAISVFSQPFAPVKAL